MERRHVTLAVRSAMTPDVPWVPEISGRDGSSRLGARGRPARLTGPARANISEVRGGGDLAMRLGRRLRAWPIHQGRTGQLWQCDLTREDGALVAQGRVRLQNVRSRTGGV